MTLSKLTKNNPNPTSIEDSLIARAIHINPIIDKVNELSTTSGVIDTGSVVTTTLTTTTILSPGDVGTSIGGLTISGGAIRSATGGVSTGTDDSIEYTQVTELDATKIVGTSAGQIGHTGGAILVTAPTSDYALEFISAVLVFDYSTAAYTGGNDDMTIRVGSVSYTAQLTDANSIKATGDKVYSIKALNTSELNLPVGSSINIAGTAFTNPGTAAGKLNVYVTYRKIKTNL